MTWRRGAADVGRTRDRMRPRLSSSRWSQFASHCLRASRACCGAGAAAQIVLTGRGDTAAARSVHVLLRPWENSLGYGAI